MQLPFGIDFCKNCRFFSTDTVFPQQRLRILQHFLLTISQTFLNFFYGKEKQLLRDHTKNDYQCYTNLNAARDQLKCHV